MRQNCDVITASDVPTLPDAGSRRLKLSADRVSKLVWEIGIGLSAAAVAVGLRMLLPLAPQQLPTITLVIALPIVTMYVGARAGICTALSGGMLTWYLVFRPFSWQLENGSWIPLIGFAVIASVIITTAYLYRTSQNLHHERELAKITEQARTAELFANELAHRLKNALAVVQSIAAQSLSKEAPETDAFMGRVRALARANDLLAEHVSAPTANLRDVVASSLEPFRDLPTRFDVRVSDLTLSGQQAISLALTLHELATNAMKFGALTTAQGRVLIDSEVEGDRTRLTWEETGGPAVMPPRDTGFGIRLIRRSGANAHLAFKTEGFRCSLELPGH